MTDNPDDSRATILIGAEFDLTPPSVVSSAAEAMLSFAGKRCVVTGGLGFIGSNLALRLADAGADVAIIDALVPRHGGDRRNIDGASRVIEVRIADIGEASLVAPVLDGADFIFNLAGQVSHMDSMDDPMRDLDLNARSHLAFLECLRTVNPTASVVHTSTRQVYGRPLYNPVDEEHPARPVDVNGVNKLAGEQFHLLYAQVYGMRISALRLTNVFGPRQRLRGDDQGFLPIFIRRAFENQPITLYGEGEQLRDCLYIDDVVDAMLLAAVSPDASGELFNVGHPSPHTLREIAEVIVQQVGGGTIVQVPWPRERSAIDIGSFRSDVSKIKRVLGWEPSATFEQGVEATAAFFRPRLGWYL